MVQRSKFQKFKPELFNVVLDKDPSFAPKNLGFKRQSKPDQQMD
jgi:hypothetical protein